MMLLRKLAVSLGKTGNPWLDNSTSLSRLTIEHDNNCNLKEQIAQLFIKWKRREGPAQVLLHNF